MADFKRITGGSFDGVAKSLEQYGLQYPLVYDSRKEKVRVKVNMLVEKATELGQSFLTIEQAAQVLNTKPSRVIGIEGRMIRYGFEVPEIKVRIEIPDPIPMKQEKYDNTYTEFPGKLNGTIDPLNYPVGLQVIPMYLNPIRNEIHYLVI